MTDQLNGWSVREMTDAIAGVRQQPEAGKLTWRGTVRWDGAFGLSALPTEIEQLGQAMVRRFVLRGDHPPELLGHNTGPTAIETLLAALGSCVAGTFAAQATARGIALDALEVDVEAKLDLNGFFGLMAVAPGVSDVKLVFRVQADAGPETLREILDATRRHSPVFDSVSRPVPVDATLVAREAAARPAAAAR